jgi:hypothetical protein
MDQFQHAHDVLVLERFPGRNANGDLPDGIRRRRKWDLTVDESFAPVRIAMLTAEAGDQLPSSGMLPTTSTFSPYTVVTVASKETYAIEAVGVVAGVVVGVPRLIV